MRTHESEDRRAMRSITVVCTPSDTHPAHELVEESSLSRERIYHTTVMEDGTMILLGRLRGDLDRARWIFDEEDDVLGYSVSGAKEGSGLAYVHARPPAGISELLNLPREHEVFFDFPIEGTKGGGLRIVMIGETNDVLQDALAAVPDDMDVRVERIGAYPGTSGDPAGLLTDRQREVLDVALEMGYYDVPRRATHGDIADRIGLSVGTVSEHLQKIEARVFETFEV